MEQPELLLLNIVASHSCTEVFLFSKDEKDPRHHQILLAKNAQGYKNLVKVWPRAVLVESSDAMSISWKDRHDPVTDLYDLVKAQPRAFGRPEKPGTQAWLVREVAAGCLA